LKTGLAVMATLAGRSLFAGGGPRPVQMFRADHLFVIIIRDRRSKEMLFMGRLANPA
jgi:serine protease inhibitor